MAGGVFSSAKLHAMTIRESANDGSDFTNPDADYRRLFLGEDGQLHVKDSSGTVTDIGISSGSVATDAIWDQAGDIVQGTGSNAGAKLPAGSSGQFLGSNGAAAANSWKYPPGYELDYAEITSSVNVTNTSEGAADTVITGTSKAYTAEPVIAHFFSPFVQSAFTTFCIIILYDVATSTVIGRLARLDAASPKGQPIKAEYRFTPTAATHQYRVKAYIDAGTKCEIFGAAGGSAAYLPAFLRITKV